MKLKERCKRFISGFLAVTMLVGFDVNPLATIAGQIANLDIISRVSAIKDNLEYMAEKGESLDVQAEEVSCSCSFTCDAYDAISDLVVPKMNNLKQELMEVNNNLTLINTGIGTLHTDLTAINGLLTGIQTTLTSMDATLTSIDGTLSRIEKELIKVNQNLVIIQQKLDMINQTIKDAQHQYRVAHLYSLNNQFDKALWRPYISDLPYISDFAQTTGKFANVYNGYWDSNVSTISNPAGSQTQRALEVLGYDAIVRYEGVVMTEVQFTEEQIKEGATGIVYTLVNNGVNEGLRNMQDAKPATQDQGTPDGLSGQSSTLAPTDWSKKYDTVISLQQQFIDEEAVTWLDAITVLYKALGQEQVTYQSFMSYDPTITPETSPAYQNLSNILTGAGYDFYVFANRSNIIAGFPGENGAMAVPIYWVKGVADGFVSESQDMNAKITASDFFILASGMMQAYGEPVINRDEIMALLQVYGSQYPSTLGFEVADAWAYLKVRGCLNDSVIPSGFLSRANLLDICMCIKDEDSRSDYKVIDITMDIGDSMISSGYYPVSNANVTVNSFSSSVEYEYSTSKNYTYMIAKTPEVYLGESGIIRAFRDPQCTSKMNTMCNMSTIEVQGNEYYVLDIPVNHNQSVYLAAIDMDKGERVVDGSVRAIEIPAKVFGGGIFLGGYSVKDTENGKIATVLQDDVRWKEFDYLSGNKDVVTFVDYKRADKPKPSGTSVSVNGTLKDNLLATVSEWTTPMQVEATGNKQSTVATTNKLGTNDRSGKIQNTSISSVVGNAMAAALSTSTIISNAIGIVSSADKVVSTVQNVAANPNAVTSPGTALGEDFTSALVARASIKHDKDQLALKYYNEAFPKHEPILWVNGGSGDVCFVRMANSNNTLFLNRMVKLTEYTDARKVVENGGDLDAIINGILTDSASIAAAQKDANLSSAVSTLLDSINSNKDVNGKITSIEKTTNPDGTESTKLTDKGGTVKLPYQSFPLQYAVGMCSLETIVERKTGGFQESDNYEISSPVKDFLLTKPDAASEKNTNIEAKQTAQGITEIITNTKNVDGMNLSQHISEAINQFDAKVYSKQVGIYSYEASDSDAFLDLVGASSLSASDSLWQDATVETSCIMSRTEQIMLSWTDLLACGVVMKNTDGGKPKLQEDGSYHLWTDDGVVKVNNTLKTIQIGTTLYDLTFSGGDSPNLVFIDTENDEMYFDVRCVMGIIRSPFVRNDTRTEELKNSIGSGNYAIYDISSNGTNSNLFNVVKVQCFNFPEISETSFAEGLPAGSASYDIKMVSETMWDNNYWKSPIRNRLLLSSFVPSANWITVIDDDGSTRSGSLYVFYPMEAFKNGFDDGGGVIQANAPPDADTRWADLKMHMDNAEIKANKGGTSLQAIVDEIYDVSYESYDSAEWYIKMSIDAIATLYLKTGRFYCSPNFVIREFNLSKNNYTEAMAWSEYSGFSKEDNGAYWYDISGGKLAGEYDGAVYWLDGIGFVYNMPTVKDFTLKDYFEGKYPLPLALDQDNKFKATAAVINFNMNYYGTGIDKNGGETKIPYGYVLSSEGYIHYNTLSPLSGMAYDDLPHNGDQKNGDMLLPFKIGSGEVTDGLTLAPSAIYFYFGGNTIENMNVKSISEFNTTTNKFLIGSNRIGLDKVSTDGTFSYFHYVSDKYNSIKLDANTQFFRVHRNNQCDTLIMEDGFIKMGSISDVNEVVIDDLATNPMIDFLEGLGAISIVKSLDEGASWIILFVFWVFPIIGIIVMTILVGLSFLCDNKTVQIICAKTIDPVSLLTGGHHTLETWRWNRVLVPCMMLYIVFALWLNGNLIRLLMYAAEYYSTVTAWLELRLR